MAINPKSSPRVSAILDAVKQAARQEQFLEVVSADEARRRFDACIDRSPLGGESLALGAALSRVLAADVVAPVDAPPFDRSNVDGFALRAADTVGAGDASPKIFCLNAEVIACGDAPKLEVAPGTATAIAMESLWTSKPIKAVVTSLIVCLLWLVQITLTGVL